MIGSVNDELEIVWNKAVMACLQVLSQNLPEGLRNTTQKFDQNTLLRVEILARGVPNITWQ
jgi:hypothetical protein